MLRHLFHATALLLATALPSAAQQAAAPANQRIDQRADLCRRAQALSDEGKWADAARLGEQLVVIEREVFGENNERVQSTLTAIAVFYEKAEAFESAARWRQEAYSVAHQLHPAGHWLVIDARLALDEAKAAAALTDEQQRARLDANHAYAEGLMHFQHGEHAEARTLARQSADTRRAVFGREHRDYCSALILIAATHTAQQQYAESEPLLEEVLAIRKQTMGAAHPETIGALDDLAQNHAWAGNTDKALSFEQQALDACRALVGSEHVDTASLLLKVGALHHAKHDSTRAAESYREALAIREKLLGAGHADTLAALERLAELYRKLGNARAAEPLYQRAVEINTRLHGRDSLETMFCITQLAGAYADMGQPAKGLTPALEAVEIGKRIAGEDSTEVARALHNVASLYEDLADYATAEPLYRKALAILKQTRGEEHAETMTALNSLANLYGAMGDRNRAETLQRQVLETRRKIFGDKHVDTAGALNNLAATCDSQGDYQSAVKYYRQALDIYVATLGQHHPNTATCLANLAVVCKETGNYVEASTFGRMCLLVRSESLGEDHVDRISAKGGLAMIYYAGGLYQVAEPLLREATESLARVLGEDHPLTAAHFVRLGALTRQLGDPARGEPLLRKGVGALFIHLQNGFAVQSERQKLLALEELRTNLDLWLSVTTETPTPAEDVYEKLLAWKGAVFAAESAPRTTDDPAAAGILVQYQDVSRQLATAALALPRNFDERAKRDERLKQLTEQKEALENEVARDDAGFARRRGGLRVEPSELNAALPAGVALVDFFEYRHTSRAKVQPRDSDAERRLLAFVVRRDQPLVRVDLGSMDRLAAAIDRWRSCFGIWQGAAAEDPALELRRILWEPIAAHLGDANTVLVSPDGVLAQLPFAALPGDKAGEYLIHRYAVATIPAPQLLPQMLDQRVERPADETASLLLVGGVDYGGSAGRANVAGASRTAERGASETADRAAAISGFKPLPATLGEIQAIDASFRRRYRQGQSDSLAQDQATEAAFRELAPRHRWLHLSTHGFFAPEKLKNALERSRSPTQGQAADLFSRAGVGAFHPGLLSGLAMAGANTRSDPGEDDGILTALEVASLDLSKVDVAVLSACETGLGRVAGGEGMLGLQRAFQVSGAKSVVASLWSVRDEATMLLMQRFYANLWDRNMSKVEALREAQRWLLSEPAHQSLLTDEDRRASAAAGQTSLPPHYWAAFVLSGDWR